MWFDRSLSAQLYSKFRPAGSGPPKARTKNLLPPYGTKKLIPALSGSRILPLIPPRLARARNSSMGFCVRMGACRAASDIGAPGDYCRPREVLQQGEVPRFNSRSNSRCTGGWWVHGSKGSSLPFRLRVPRNAGSAAAGCMNKTWHCPGAAKAASEVQKI